MAAWTTLFELAVVHGFFAPARCEGLRLVPAPAAAAWMARCGARWCETAEGGAVVSDRPDLAAAHGRGEFELALASRDPWFGAYTQGAPAGQVGVVELDAAEAGSDWSEAPAAAAASCWPPGRPGEPLLWLRVALGPWLMQGPRRWRVRLAPRAVHWKYLLPAEWAVQQPEVVDTAGQIAFAPVVPAVLGDGRAALTTVSQQAIPLAARPPQRFQLQARAPLADPVLVKRLPVASAGRLGVETIAGARSLVSEIHVNR